MPLPVLRLTSGRFMQALSAMLPTDNAYTPLLLRGTDTFLGQNVGMITRVNPAATLTRSAARVDYPVPGSECGFTGTGSSGVSKHYRTLFGAPCVRVYFD